MYWPWSSPLPLIALQGPHLTLRLPQMRDYAEWYALRRASRDFLKPFEPRWTEADLARRVFAMRVRRARQEAEEGTDFTFFLFTRGQGAPVRRHRQRAQPREEPAPIDVLAHRPEGSGRPGPRSAGR